MSRFINAEAKKVSYTLVITLLPAKEPVLCGFGLFIALVRNKTELQLLRISFWTFWVSLVLPRCNLGVEGPRNGVSLTSNERLTSACFYKIRDCLALGLVPLLLSNLPNMKQNKQDHRAKRMRTALLNEATGLDFLSCCCSYAETQ